MDKAVRVINTFPFFTSNPSVIQRGEDVFVFHLPTSGTHWVLGKTPDGESLKPLDVDNFMPYLSNVSMLHFDNFQNEKLTPHTFLSGAKFFKGKYTGYEFNVPKEYEVVTYHNKFVTLRFDSTAPVIRKHLKQGTTRISALTPSLTQIIKQKGASESDKHFAFSPVNIFGGVDHTPLYDCEEGYSYEENPSMPLPIPVLANNPPYKTGSNIHQLGDDTEEKSFDLEGLISSLTFPDAPSDYEISDLIVCPHKLVRKYQKHIPISSPRPVTDPMSSLFAHFSRTYVGFIPFLDSMLYQGDRDYDSLYEYCSEVEALMGPDPEYIDEPDF